MSISAAAIIELFDPISDIEKLVTEFRKTYPLYTDEMDCHFMSKGEYKWASIEPNIFSDFLVEFKDNYEKGDIVSFCFMIDDLIQSITFKNNIIYIDTMKDSELKNRVIHWDYLNPVIHKILDLTDWNMRKIEWNQIPD